MPNSLIKTKLRRPVIPSEQVERPCLESRLDEGLQPGQRLLLISAPAGYGKTTLATEWLQRREAAGQAISAWISLDTGDNDPARFFSYVMGALKLAIPALDLTVLSLLELPTLPPIEAVLTELINTLEEQLSNRKLPIILVLDDYFLIQNLVIHQGVDFLIEHLPEELRLLIITREDPPLPLARLRARRQMVEVRMADLRFSIQEAARFFEQIYHLVLSPEDLELLDGRTEGWIAGLQLAGLVLRDSTLGSPETTREKLTVKRLVSSVPHYIIDYLVEEVLERQPQSIREFLIRSSILSRLNSELCDGILSSPDNRGFDSAAILDHLAQANLFLIPLDSERCWYRYHPLFADVLRSHLSTQEEIELHRRAAGWLEANGYLEEALEHSMSGSDVEASTRMIVRQADAWMKGGEVYTLLSHLSVLPEDVILSNNDLTAYYGFALMFAGKGVEAARFAKAAHPNREEGLAMGRLMTLKAWLANMANEPQMLDLARKALELLGDADPFFQALALIVLGSHMDWEGDHSAAAKTYLEAYEIGQEIDHPFLAIGSLSNLAYDLLEQGCFQEGISLCESAERRYVDAHSRPLPVASMLDGPLAALYFEIGDWEKARQHATTGLDRCGQLFSPAILGGNAEVILARLAFMDGHLEKSLDLLHQTRQFAVDHQLGYLSFKMAAAETLLLLLNDDAAAARIIFRELLPEKPFVADGKNSQKRLQGVQQVLTFLEARLLLADGQAAGSLALFERISPELQGLRRIEAGVIHALALAALNQNTAAREKIRGIIGLAANTGCIWAFHAVGKKDTPILLAMLKQARPAAPTFVDRLIQSFSTSPSKAKEEDNPIASLPEPLSEQELKVLQLLFSGRSNQQIAEALVISLGTAKWHVHNVLQKLGASSRSQAIAMAKEMGIL